MPRFQSRRIRIGLFAVATLVCGFVLATAFESRADDDTTQDLSDTEVQSLMKLVASNKSESIDDDLANRFVKTLRRKYAFQSIREILPNWPAELKQQVVNLRDEASSSLASYEGVGRAARTHGHDLRSRALQSLHESQVRDFIARDGNGFGRLPAPSPVHLEIELISPVPRDIGPALGSDQQGGPNREFAEDEPSAHRLFMTAKGFSDDSDDSMKKFKAWAKGTNPLLMPARNKMLSMHEYVHDDFLVSGKSGYVKSIDEVAGYTPHHVAYRPTVDTGDRRKANRAFRLYAKLGIDNQSKNVDKSELTDPWREAPKNAIWLLTDLELVSLLKHDQPMVYESEFLPTMDPSGEAYLRNLNDFEATALRSLFNGEQLSVQAHTNEIRMLGAIRASKSCVVCHEGMPHGALLGAFSYHLTRAKPIPTDSVTAFED